MSTLALPDREVEVWYPARRKSTAGADADVYDLRTKIPQAIGALLPADADLTFPTAAFRDVPAAKARRGFPLVALAHGTGSYRESMSHLSSHLASWGFVVAAPDITELGLASVLGTPAPNPRDGVEVLRDTVTLLQSESARTGGPLRRRVRAGAVAVVGEASGATTALRFGSEPEVLAVVAFSASGYDAARDGFLPFPAVPVMFVTGTADAIVPIANVKAGFGEASPPARLVAVDGAARATFTDVCPIGGEGGLIAVAARTNLPVPAEITRLASDGCATGPRFDDVWPVSHHVVTAQLRDAFGIDEESVGLRPAAMARFAPVVVRYEERL